MPAAYRWQPLDTELYFPNSELHDGVSRTGSEAGTACHHHSNHAREHPEQHKRPGDMADQACPSRQAEYFWFFDRYLIGVVSR
jgi:hypothetical protein